LKRSSLFAEIVTEGRRIKIEAITDLIMLSDRKATTRGSFQDNTMEKFVEFVCMEKIGRRCCSPVGLA
jgi:hypothetical protein